MNKKLFTLGTALVLALSLAACAKAPTPTQVTEPSGQTEATLTFTFRMVNGETVEEKTVTTTKAKAGEALLEQGLIQGEEGPYGLYVKTVLDVTLDYDKDGAWWGVYVNGESSLVGVDSVVLEEGMIVELRAETA
jgi:hypothetical protein